MEELRYNLYLNTVYVQFCINTEYDPLLRLKIVFYMDTIRWKLSSSRLGVVSEFRASLCTGPAPDHAVFFLFVLVSIDVTSDFKIYGSFRFL